MIDQKRLAEILEELARLEADYIHLRDVEHAAMITVDELQECYLEADRRMKENNGHSFVTILKTRCEYCHRSPKVKTRCGGWFQSFTSHLSDVLHERGVIRP